MEMVGSDRVAVSSSDLFRCCSVAVMDRCCYCYYVRSGEMALGLAVGLADVDG